MNVKTDLPVQDIDPRKLVPYEKNAKKHSKKQVADLAATFRVHGFDQPVVVDKDLVIIKGHGRTLGAIEAEMPTVPVIVRTDLTEEQVKAARIADNQLSSTDYDTVLLQEEVAELDLSGYDMDSMGFTERELNMLTDDLTGLDDAAIMEDLEMEIDEATQHHDQVVEEAKTKPVRIADALGFKAIPGDSEREVAQFMAEVEDSTGETGADAFLTFIRRIAA